MKSRSGLIGLVVVVCYLLMASLGPVVDRRDPLQQNLNTTLRPPGQDGYLLGSDELGRDTLARIIHGARISMVIGITAVSLGALIGIPLGLMSGYYGGRFDGVLMRITDILLALPRILLAVTIAAIYGLGFWSLVIAIGFPDIPVFARVTRSSTLSVARLDYVAAAKAMGIPESRIMIRHILPNVFGPVIVQATFDLATAILTAGGLSFLGLGIQPPTPEWGSMLAQGKRYMRIAPHLIALPGLALAVLILGINLLGDALRQAYDPRFRGRD
ncbi:MAG: ABC transporter permease [Armatimonadota bacterium]